MIFLLGTARRAWQGQSGATAVEFALVCFPLLLLVLGIAEFGRALYVRNDLSHAADVAARKVLIGQIARDATESEAQTKIESVVRDHFDSGDALQLQITVGKVSENGVDFRVLTIRYPLTLLLPGSTATPIKLQMTRRIPIG